MIKKKIQLLKNMKIKIIFILLENMKLEILNYLKKNSINKYKIQLK